MRFVTLRLTLLLLVVAAVSCGESESDSGGVSKAYDAYPSVEVDPDRPYNAIFTTSVGRMTFNLLPAEAPLAVASFAFLANEGFYDGLTFFRVLPGVLAESGDATGSGTGDAGYTFEIEPPQRPYARGLIAMANTGPPNSNGSRFFIILGDLSTVPGEYTIFGHIKEGHGPSEKTLAKIDGVPVGPAPNGEVSLPQEEIEVMSVKVIEGCRAGMSMWTQGCGA